MQKIKILAITLIPLLATSIFAATYIVKPQGILRIDIDDLEGSKIIINTTKTYVPFELIIEDVPVGYYILDIPKEELESLICAPTVFNITSSGEDLSITCIAKPTEDTIEAKLKRQYNGTTKAYDFTFEIKNIKIWYEVWSGGIEAGYYITNGKYIIEHKPRQLVSQLIIKKGQEVVWTGLMFPGQEEKITDNLKIKFLGALDNITYLKVYSTSDDKFYLVQAKPEVVEKIVKEYIYPECKVEDDWIIISHTNATIIYTDGSNETLNAIDTPIKLKKKDIARVICGYVLDIKPIKLETKPKEEKKEEEKPRFLIYPKSKYYVGETVSISATKEFEISCTDGTYQITKVFTKVFNEPVQCTIVLDSTVKQFSVVPKQAVQPQPKKEEKRGIDMKLLIIAFILLAGGYIYYMYKQGKIEIPFKKKKEEEKQEEETEEVEYRVKSALEGKH